jgi:hypothetical protein
MSTIICVKSVPVKPVRRTPRPSVPFGQGILASHPFAGRMPYTQADLDEAAQMFADSRTEAITPDWDALAQEAEYQAKLDAMAPAVFGRCLNCSMPCDDLTFQGLCDRCDDLADDASTASRNYSAGLGFQVF